MATSPDVERRFAAILVADDTSPYLKCRARGRLNLQKAFCNLS